MWTLLHSRLHITLRQRNLLPKKECILIAVSGGQDSLCLLKLLLDLQSKWTWKIAIAHCDHGWKHDTGIADFVQQLSEKWRIPFYLKTTSQLKETEAAARNWRYQALTEIAQENNFSIIVTGHTQSDRAETLLYNLVRGAGNDGLSALTWQRPLTDNIILVRPLLTINRSEIWEFCQKCDLPIWEDLANENLNYARNRIRKELIPYFKKNFNPQIETTLARTAEIVKEETEYLESCAEINLEKALNRDGTQLNRLVLQSVPLALQRRVMRRFFLKISLKNPNFEQIEALTTLINAPRRSRISSLPGNLIAEVQDNWIIFTKQETVQNSFAQDTL
ncbi:putative cell cycle control PP-loop ATPase MesJ/YaeO [cyanobacterium endosymbiont of Rhopalodia gibberula]|uniref:tRNA lysidine(34) synthetase TilS n=1 Tax=cyanobacterium endosymbiont of Rhopalodia gibberula TaxID=1763363 RepID=UPI000DC72E90|nr:tRNA lysidine(34) synthetase TilS [cyanobacterium endosymbiont of Rhopalodia gibberula]BBA79482.1 putative cell cycle control PP-loop ATPase MesJ/YaeO [cyanobacterium endosymbiont of Rhopalodia gibberula]